MTDRVTQVRPGCVADTPHISQFLGQFADQIRASPDADISHFFRSVEPAVLASEMQRGVLVYWLLEVAGEIGGLVGLRHGEHLYHLFVRADLQHRGYGRRLCERAMDYLRANGVSTLTVSSSVKAVGFYRTMGFVPNGPQQTKNGIAFVPMEAMVEKD